MAISAPYLIAAKQLLNNAGQRKAYASSGHCVLLAGPGSGKTKTLTIKLARVLAEDIKPPRGVACITYNNQCARELKRRLQTLGAFEDYRLAIGTLHSFCLQHIILPYLHLTPIPKKYPLTVATSAQSARLKQKAIDKTIGNQQWNSFFDKYRRTHLDRGIPAWRDDDEEKAVAIEKYEELLDQEGLIDFDGMVLIGLHLVENYSWVRKAISARFPVIAVDEYQDLGYPLDRIIQELCFNTGIRLIAVGDPDQSIYGFTGAEPSLLEALANRPNVEAIHLWRNYRCGSNIIKASGAALGLERQFEAVSTEPGTVFLHTRPGGIADQTRHICETIIPSALERRAGRKYGDIAVLYVDKNDGDYIADAASESNYKYLRVDGNNPYQASPVTYWLEDCAAWCSKGWQLGFPLLSQLLHRWATFNESISNDTAIRASVLKVIKFLHANRNPDALLHNWLIDFYSFAIGTMLETEPRCKEDAICVKRLIEVTAPGAKLESLTVAYFGGQGGSPDHLNFTTLHSAKGLEFDVVIIMGLEEGRIPYYNSSPAEIKERRRLFYVGLTRARHEVHLVYSGWYCDFYGRRWQKGPSRFVQEVAASMKV